MRIPPPCKIAHKYKMNLDGPHIDFGCGGAPRNPFKCKKLETIDVYKISETHPTHLIEPGAALPFSENAIKSLSAYDVLEHISRDNSGKNEFIFYMNEFFRVLQPGGVAVFVFPDYPGKTAFSDPTHINFITDETIGYFIGKDDGSYYAGITAKFELIANKKIRLWKHWINSASIGEDQSEISLRRRISLGKRALLRFAIPSHRIWILRKPD